MRLFKLILFVFIPLFFTAQADFFKQPSVEISSSQESVLRQGYAQLANDWKSGNEIKFNLFSDLQFVGQITKDEALSASSKLYQGTISDDPNGYFIISDIKGTLSVRINRLQQVITISTNLKEKRYDLVVQTKAERVECKGDHKRSPPLLTRSKATAAVIDPTDNKTIVGVGLIATQSGLDQHYGGHGEAEELAFEAHLQTEIAEINRAYDNSLINLKLVLSGYRVTTYVDVSHQDDLDVLTDGTNADVLAKRTELHETEGADMIGILGKTGGGLAWVGLGNPYMAAGVKSGWYVLGHEWGHNFGCLHDKNTDDDPNPTHDKRGWLFTGNDGVYYNTIMAYFQDGSQAYQGFSNPNVLHEGVATGDINEANNARVIEESRLNAERYNKNPSVSMTSPAEGLSYASTSSITLSSNAIDLDSTIAKVDYYVGTTLIASSTTSPFSATWDTPTVGSVTMFARATDLQGATADSASVTFTVTGSIEPAIMSGNIILTEGSSKDYDVALNGVPGETVTVTLVTSNSSEVTVSPSILTFDSSNWNVNQAVTFTATDDAQDNDQEIFTVNYTWSSTGLNGSINRDVIVEDNDTSALNITVTDQESGENGDTATVSIELNTQPNADVVVSAIADAAEGNVENVLTFTTENWNQAQSLIIQGVDDDVTDGDVSYNVAVSVASSDTKYSALTDTVTLINKDNEVAAVNVTHTNNPLIVEEGGLTDRFSIVLNSKPEGPVSLTITGHEQVSLSANTVSFDQSNYSHSVEITVTAINDDVTEFTETIILAISVDSSSSGSYKDLSVSSVSVKVLDVPTPTETDVNTVVTDLRKDTTGTDETEILTTVNDIYKISNGDLSTTERETILTYLDNNLNETSITSLDTATTKTILSTVDSLFPKTTGGETPTHSEEEYKHTVGILENISTKTTLDSELTDLTITVLSRIIDEQNQLIEAESDKALTGDNLRQIETTLLKLADSNISQFSEADASTGRAIEIKANDSSIIQKALDPSTMEDNTEIASSISNLVVTIPKSVISEPSVVSISTMPLNVYADKDTKEMLSQLVNIDIYSISTGQKLTISGLTERIKLKFSIDVNNYKKTPTSLRYFDTTKNIWSNEGLRNLNIDFTANTVEVETDHLTAFAVVSDAPQPVVIFTKPPDGGGGGCLMKRHR